MLFISLSVTLVASNFCSSPLILLSNRDEFFSRPTSTAAYSKSNNTSSIILAPYDLAREERGTWIGVTDTGRIGVLVNYKESSLTNAISKVSRGLLVKEFLNSDINASNWEHFLLKKFGREGLENVGGFSFVYSDISQIFDSISTDIHTRTEKLNLRVISNRGPSDVKLNTPNEYFGLSNSLVSEPWPKVHMGEKLLRETVETSLNESWNELELIDELFQVLSKDSLPTRYPVNSNEFFGNLQHSIFIPSVQSPTDIVGINSPYVQSPLQRSPLLNSVSKNENGISLDGIADLNLENSLPNSNVEHRESDDEKGSSSFSSHLSVNNNNSIDRNPRISNIIGKYYGTRTQTIIMVKKNGELKYIEKTLHDVDHKKQTDAPFINTFSMKIRKAEVSIYN